ncbi:hypothetical protein AZE42_14153 [Rhizopogon vesiculosus]|uniref:Uncharacterized protein n=1 Tax=Rhizopogon vesiculosus TaxID=180088 RepID=A0A1J8RHI6_9AGAM|nr:hypothetical protein AZE42_14153 [Rhizopogon vesiculosus]
MHAHQFHVQISLIYANGSSFAFFVVPYDERN